MKRILILGGTGFVGRHVCEKLVRAACHVTVATRRLAAARDLSTLPLLQPVACDVHDEAALTRLVAGHDAVVNLVAILQGSAQAFEHTHVRLPAQLAAACEAAGVKRVVHVSALGVGLHAPSNYLRSKAAGEAALAPLGQALTLLRPSVIFGARDRFLNTFARLQALAPVVPLAGASSTFQPVWVEDVAQAIVHSLLKPENTPAVLECAGPEVYTLAELVRLAGQWSGRARPILPLPGPLATLQALAMEALPGEPLMSRDNLASMQVPNVATGQLPGLAALGITPASLKAIGPAYLSPGQGCARLDALRTRAGRR